MVYTVILKWLSFKQDLSDTAAMLNDEKSTYVILRYADDIPQSVLSEAMEFLVEVEGGLTYRKLIDLVKQYKAASNIQMTMDEEHDETIELIVDENGQLIVKKLTDDSGATIIDFDDDDDDDIVIIGINK